MLDHKDPVASIIPAMSLDSPSDNAMAAMSRLAGELTRGTIENCYVTGPVSGGGEVEGLVGWVQHSAITASAGSQM